MARIRWVLLLLLSLPSSALPAARTRPARADDAPAARGVGCIGLTVSDADRASEFYTRVLDFRRELSTEVAGESWERLQGVFGLRARTMRVRLGNECLDLTEYLAPRGRPVPADARSNDRSFQHVAIVVSDMDEAYRRLRDARVEHASTGPQRLPDWNPNAGGIRAFYFRDPDRHVLEVIWFPPGKGDRRWQGSRGARPLFLGIDHTAIVVGDTEASLRFWRGALGFRVAGTSENWGTEQEHLNSVFGARLRITALRAPEGPGVELLEYLAPRDGRPLPADERANDHFHWQTTVRVADLDAAARAARGSGLGWISPGPVSVAEQQLGFSRALLARDPDGHVVQLSVAVTNEARSTR
ncbi:MAG TPA: VOC family protein [Anaeromyxobacteraceae bacterium]|nr:VOC family protein [Anaeromyxobacteraceae bacterium]